MDPFKIIVLTIIFLLGMSQKGPETRAKAKEKQIDYEKAFPVFQTREELVMKL